MECPYGHGNLEKVLFHNVEVDYCLECMGVFFEKDELALAKNDEDKQLNWLDFDIWRDKGKFQMVPTMRKCPACRVPMIHVMYDKSNVKIDFCKNCQGIWLDRGEFKQIMIYLKKKADYEILHHYTKNLIVQLWEVFAGPKHFRDELEEFLMLIKLFNYKFIVQHPHLEELIEKLPK